MPSSIVYCWICFQNLVEYGTRLVFVQPYPHEGRQGLGSRCRSDCPSGGYGTPWGSWWRRYTWGSCTSSLLHVSPYGECASGCSRHSWTWGGKPRKTNNETLIFPSKEKLYLKKQTASAQKMFQEGEYKWNICYRVQHFIVMWTCTRQEPQTQTGRGLRAWNLSSFDTIKLFCVPFITLFSFIWACWEQYVRAAGGSRPTECIEQRCLRTSFMQLCIFSNCKKGKGWCCCGVCVVCGGVYVCAGQTVQAKKWATAGG